MENKAGASMRDDHGGRGFETHRPGMGGKMKQVQDGEHGLVDLVEVDKPEDVRKIIANIGGVIAEAALKAKGEYKATWKGVRTWFRVRQAA